MTIPAAAPTGHLPHFYEMTAGLNDYTDYAVIAIQFDGKAHWIGISSGSCETAEMIGNHWLAQADEYGNPVDDSSVDEYQIFCKDVTVDADGTKPVLVVTV